MCVRHAFSPHLHPRPLLSGITGVVYVTGVACVTGVVCVTGAQTRPSKPLLAGVQLFSEHTKPTKAGPPGVAVHPNDLALIMYTSGAG